MKFKGKILNRGKDWFQAMWNNGEVLTYRFKVGGESNRIECNVDRVVKGFHRKHLIIQAHELEKEVFGYVRVWVRGKDGKWQVQKVRDLFKHGQSPSHNPRCDPQAHYDWAKHNLFWEMPNGAKYVPTIDDWKKHCRISKIVGLD